MRSDNEINELARKFGAAMDRLFPDRRTRYKTARLTVTWERYNADPICAISIEGDTDDNERRRLLLSLAHALIARYTFGGDE